MSIELSLGLKTKGDLSLMLNSRTIDTELDTACLRIRNDDSWSKPYLLNIPKSVSQGFLDAVLASGPKLQN